MYTIVSNRQRASGKLLYSQGAESGALYCPRGEMVGVGGSFKRGRDICIHGADSLHCTALYTKTALCKVIIIQYKIKS